MGHFVVTATRPNDAACLLNQAAGVTNDFLGLGINAAQANNSNSLASAGMGLQAGLANQSAGLQGNQLNLQGQIANQQNQQQKQHQRDKLQQ